MIIELFAKKKFEIFAALTPICFMSIPVVNILVFDTSQSLALYIPKSLALYIPTAIACFCALILLLSITFHILRQNTPHKISQVKTVEHMSTIRLFLSSGNIYVKSHNTLYLFNGDEVLCCPPVDNTELATSYPIDAYFYNSKENILLKKVRNRIYMNVSQI